MAQEGVSRRFFVMCTVLVLIVLSGTLGYAWLEGWSVGDGFYMTMITLSTVGYGETNELSSTGRIFTVSLIVACLFTTTCWTAALTSVLIEDDLSGRFSMRRMKRMIDKLQGHTIVCGTGLLAQAVIERLMPKRVDVVLIDSDAKSIELLKRRFRKLMVVEGNATSELTLAQANIANAKTVVAATDSEIDNLLIGITCKDVAASLSVIAQANDPTITNRMRKAGVDEILSPIQLCGERVAQWVSA